MDHIRRSLAQRGFVRSRHGRLLGGVCAGLGRRFGLGDGTARVLFVVLLLVVPGSQLLVYPVLWVLMPLDGTAAAAGHPRPPSPAPTA